MNNVLMNNRIAFIGIGQAGGNLANEFRKLKYTAFYINTSIVDLNTIDIDNRYKYHIPYAEGCNKNRDLAKKYAKDQYEAISNQVATKLGNITNLFFCFSMGGGTGSGISPSLINKLAKKMPNVAFNCICIIPAETESATIKHNAIDCYEELKQIQYLSNIYFVDNNYNIKESEVNIFPNKLNNIEYVNTQIAYRIDQILSMCNSDTRSIIDTEEIEHLLKVYGNVLVADIINGEISADNIFPTTKKMSQYIAYSLLNEEDYIKEKVEDAFGKPIDDYKGFNDSNSFIAVFGLPLPDEKFSELAKSYESDLEKIKINEDEDVVIEISKLPDITKKRKDRMEKSKRFNSLLEDL